MYFKYCKNQIVVILKGFAQDSIFMNFIDKPNLVSEFKLYSKIDEHLAAF